MHIDHKHSADKRLFAEETLSYFDKTKSKRLPANRMIGAKRGAAQTLDVKVGHVSINEESECLTVNLGDNFSSQDKKDMLVNDKKVIV